MFGRIPKKNIFLDLNICVLDIQLCCNRDPRLYSKIPIYIVFLSNNEECEVVFGRQATKAYCAEVTLGRGKGLQSMDVNHLNMHIIQCIVLSIFQRF